MINILTFINTYNYGSVLQAYALNSYMNANVGETNTIYYDLASAKTISIAKRIKIWLGRMMYIRPWLSREKKFNQFINTNIKMNKQRFKSAQELRKFPFSMQDTYIVGSDQCWCELERKEFFLDFVESKRKYAYAISLGENLINQEGFNKIKEYTREFKKVSFRELYSVQQYEKQNKQIVDYCIDPVFLLEKDSYVSLCKKSANYENYRKKKYICVYAIYGSEKMQEFLDEMQKKTNYEVVLIGGLREKIYASKMSFIRDAGVEDFLCFIYNAEYVVTDSFHATAFSIIFEKEFYSFTRCEGNSRIGNLLSYLKINERIKSDSGNVCTELSKIDYTNVNSILYEKDGVLEKSRKYLEDIKKDIQENDI